MASIVRHFRADLERSDPHWPAQLAALVAIILYATLPNKLTIGPSWLVPALESMLLVALVLATPGDEAPGSRMRQRQLVPAQERNLSSPSVCFPLDQALLAS